MKFITSAAAAALLCFAATVVADPGSTPAPMERAADKLEENLNKNPDNVGLKRALKQLNKNIGRSPGKSGEKSNRATAGNSKSERFGREASPDRVDHVEVAERVERPERAERPERPERSERVDRQAFIDGPGRSDFERSHR